MPKKSFHVTGACVPEKHYMVDMSGRIEKIVTDYIQEGKYFTVNRARQYGKTTLLFLLERRLEEEYLVLRLSFEAADELFVSLYTLAAGLIRKIGRILKRYGADEEILREWSSAVSREFPLDELGERITFLCENCKKPVALMIDEVDKSSGNHIFLSFLGLLRNKYLEQLQGKDTTFHSVILAGVYDVKNLKLKLHPGAESKYNSPWNIAADFLMDMSFQKQDIQGMLREYEDECGTGMDLPEVSGLIFDYTGGYPWLVSKICASMDERKNWTKEGFLLAVRELLRESNALFDDMIKHLEEYPELRAMIRTILFEGRRYVYETDNSVIRIGVMFGFLREKENVVEISNRIFESKLYNYFLSEEESRELLKVPDTENPNQFIRGGKLQMDLVMRKFFEYYQETCSDLSETF